MESSDKNIGFSVVNHFLHRANRTCRSRIEDTTELRIYLTTVNGVVWVRSICADHVIHSKSMQSNTDLFSMVLWTAKGVDCYVPESLYENGEVQGPPVPLIEIFEETELCLWYTLMTGL